MGEAAVRKPMCTGTVHVTEVGGPLLFPSSEESWVSILLLDDRTTRATEPPVQVTLPNVRV